MDLATEPMFSGKFGRARIIEMELRFNFSFITPIISSKNGLDYPFFLSYFQNHGFLISLISEREY